MHKTLAFLEKRKDRMQYLLYHQDGWLPGSGIVESGNKVVMQARRVWGRHAISRLRMVITCWRMPQRCLQ
jgi:hypothetical protein